MLRISEKFYENTYSPGHKSKMPPGIAGKLFKFLRPFESYREKVVLDLLPAGNRLLDIGCGEGHLVFDSLSKYKYAFGADVAGTRLSKAKRKLQKLDSDLKSRIFFRQSDADLALPFSNAYFDSVTIIAVLEHLFDPYRVIAEVRRVLKKDGILIIEVPNIGFLPRRLALLFGRLPVTSEDEAGWDGGHLHYFTPASLKTLLENYNFKVNKITCSGIFAPFRSFWVSLLGGDIIIKAVLKG